MRFQKSHRWHGFGYSLFMLVNFRAFQLSKEFYQRCKTIKLPSFLKDQLMRASSSIALNLAESSGNRTVKERVRYFTISLGSLRECEAIFDIEEIKDPVAKDPVAKDLLNQLGAVLFKLSRIPVENPRASQKASDVTYVSGCTDEQTDESPSV